MSTTETTEAVRKSVLVDADPETAFRVFTDRIQTWWPLDKHGIFGEEAEGLAFRDDQIVESAKDGREAVWGKALAWEPPRGCSSPGVRGSPTRRPTPRLRSRS